MDARDVRTAYNSVVSNGEQLIEAIKDVTASELAILNCPTDDVELLKQHREAITKANYASTLHQVAVENLDAMVKVLTFEKLSR
jgi:predicted secreted protein